MLIFFGVSLRRHSKTESGSSLGLQLAYAISILNESRWPLILT